MYCESLIVVIILKMKKKKIKDSVKKHKRTKTRESGFLNTNDWAHLYIVLLLYKFYNGVLSKLLNNLMFIL